VHPEELLNFTLGNMITISNMRTLCYMFVNDMPNSEQCTMLFSGLGKGSICIVRTRHINSVGYVLIFKLCERGYFLFYFVMEPHW
jgi:hypothetical protein